MTSAPARRGRQRTPLDPARLVAYSALRSVDDDDAYLNLVLPKLIAQSDLAARDAAFCTELAFGCARMHGSYDAVLDACVTGGTAALRPEVLTGLRLGVHQLLSMRVASHAAVGSTVELVRAAVGERPVRLVNAVLRKVSTRTLDGWIASCAPPRADDLVGHLAVRYSHPRWIVAAYLGQLTEPAAEEALAADNVAARVTLAARPGLCGVPELVAGGAEASRWSPYAATLPGGDPRAVPAVRDGRAGVQDEGSQLAALALARADLTGRDTRWLDACAGPGGKAALLSGLARQRGATLVAAERQPHRARLVQQSLRGYGAASPVLVGDSTQPPWCDDSFDRILIDAPCTGLGALRRRPEARWRRQPSDLETLVPLQTALLSAALCAARPAGVVAYVTCSPHPAETRGVVDAVLHSRRDVTELDARAVLGGVPDLGPGPHVQLWPHRHGTDAMFISLLRRASNGSPVDPLLAGTALADAAATALPWGD